MTQPSPKMTSRFLCPIRVYYEDTDAEGVVYHANYLKFFERARVESFRQMGMDLNSLKNDNCLFVVRALDMAFLQPARLDQLLQVESEVTEVKHASIHYRQKVYEQAMDATLLCEATVHLVCLDTKWHPRRVPEKVKRGLNQWQQNIH